MAGDSLTVVDNRTGQTFEVPIVDGTIRAMDFRKMKASSEDFGLMVYDPAFTNTASCRSAITFIDGDEGVLEYRGYPIEELAERSTYLETAYLLIYGSLPTKQQLAAWTHDITYHTMVHESVRKFMDGFRYDAHPMGMLVGTVGALSTFYPDAKDVDDPASRELNTWRLIAKMPTLAAFAYRQNHGLPYVYPDNSLSFVGNFLSMLWKMAEPTYEPHPVLERAIDILFILHADHEQNCSANAMRAVGSSRPDPFSATAAAAAALYGPLHGGANEAVLRMLTEIGDVKNVPDFIKRVKGGEGKLMGFGHRVYKNYDPRAKIIKRTADEVFEVTGRNPLLDIALELERIALEDEYFVQRKLYPNVDFYSGLIYQALGFPVEMFPVLFAIPRTAGWVAQWRELVTDPEQKIARPRQVYIGARGRDYAPMGSASGACRSPRTERHGEHARNGRDYRPGRFFVGPALRRELLGGGHALDEHAGDFGPGELDGELLAGAEHLADLCPREHETLLGRRGARLGRRHGARAEAPEGVLEEQGLDAELVQVDLVENALGVVGAVVVAHAGVVAAHDEVGAAVVLAHDGVEDRFPRAGVAHGRRQHGEGHAFARKVVVDEHLVALHAHVGGDVIVLGVAPERVNEGAVDTFEGDLDEVLVRAVDGVARLEAHDGFPAPFGEEGARLGRRQAVVEEVVVGGEPEGANRAAEDQVARGVKRGDARMGLVIGAVDLARLVLLVAPVGLLDVDDAEDEAVAVAQGGAGAGAELTFAGRVNGEVHGDGPGEAAGERHVIDDGAVAGFAHEAAERAEAPIREQLEVAPGARVERDRREGGDFPAEILALGATDEEVDEGAAIRFAERGHRVAAAWRRRPRSSSTATMRARLSSTLSLPVSGRTSGWRGGS
jgi:citrate synthase